MKLLKKNNRKVCTIGVSLIGLSTLGLGLYSNTLHRENFNAIANADVCEWFYVPEELNTSLGEKDKQNFDYVISKLDKNPELSCEDKKEIIDGFFENTKVTETNIFRNNIVEEFERYLINEGYLELANLYADYSQGRYFSESILDGYLTGYVNADKYSNLDTDTEQDFFGIGREMNRIQTIELLWKFDCLNSEEENYVEPNYDLLDNVTDIGGITEDQKTALAWAYTMGLTNGNSETTFGPTNDVTRVQFVTMLYRYAKKMGYNNREISQHLDKTNNDIADIARIISIALQLKSLNLTEEYLDSYNELPYTDISEIKVNDLIYAIKWAHIKEITKGKTETLFAPNDKIKKGEMVTMLSRFIENVINFDWEEAKNKILEANGSSVYEVLKDESKAEENVLGAENSDTESTETRETEEKTTEDDESDGEDEDNEDDESDNDEDDEE